MHTYRRVDGSFYDAFEPENPDDEPLPLRPSEIHEWNGWQWVWRRGTLSHRHPRLDDSVHSRQNVTLSDISAMLHEGLGRLNMLEKGHQQIQGNVMELSVELARHLEDTKEIPQILSDLRSAGRFARIFLRYMMPILIGIGILGVSLHAMFHGDFAPIKKMLGIS